MKCPCMGCEPPKRSSTCHIEGNCPEHDEWQKYAKERRENRAKANTCKDIPHSSMVKWWKSMKK